MNKCWIQLDHIYTITKTNHLLQLHMIDGNKNVCTSETISNRFGGWRNALRKIGIEKGVQAYEYTAKELIDNLEIVWRTLGYPPGKRRLREYGYGISERPYVNRWGSVRNACRLLAKYYKGEISETDLIGLETKT
jgi:hypothetical protein